MFEQVLPGLYRIEIPLPNSPLKNLNAYLVKGKDRSLIIDTGMNLKECLEAMLSSLKQLKVNLEKTDLFITHRHADHTGLLNELASKHSIVYLKDIEAIDVLKDPEKRDAKYQEYFDFYLANGFSKDELNSAFSLHPGARFIPSDSLNIRPFSDGDVLKVGDYVFKGVETPGHTSDHVCLYEAEKRILVSGDHLLFDISPNITWYPEMEDSLASYLKSLRKVDRLDVDLVLPGHRTVGNNLRARIAELEAHHKDRLSEVLHALASGEKTAWGIAPHISWDVGFGAWESFPTVQKWFALGETIAHVRHLEALGKVTAEKQNGKIIYSLNIN